MNYQKVKDLYLFFYGMGLSGSLVLFSMGMIIFHPGVDKLNASEKLIWINILTNTIALWIKSPGSDNKTENQVAIDSQNTNVLTKSNVELVATEKDDKPPN